MNNTARIIILSILAAAITYVAFPIVRKFSIRIDNVDRPKDDARKIHSHAIPNGGGIAIYIGFLVAATIFGNFSAEIIGLLVAGAALVVVGILDEIYDLSSITRLLTQTCAAAIVIIAGVRVDVIGNFGAGNDGLFSLGLLSIPFTIFWIVGVTNAIRILDGIDGLAAGVTGIASWTLGTVALMTGRPDAATFSFILGAVAFAYLPYNFSSNPKRKMFMADSGSTFLGFALAVVSVMGSVKTAAVFSMLVPIMVLIIPIFDTLFAIGRRLLAGKSPFSADGLHLHHRIMKKGLNQHQTVLIFYAVSIILGVIAVLSVGVNGAVAAVICLATISVFICALWKFGLFKPQK